MKTDIAKAIGGAIAFALIVRFSYMAGQYLTLWLEGRL